MTGDGDRVVGFGMRPPSILDQFPAGGPVDLDRLELAMVEDAERRTLAAIGRAVAPRRRIGGYYGVVAAASRHPDPVSDMIPLHRDPHFVFHFAEDRLVPRFHLDGVPPGRRVSVYRLDPATGGPLDLIAAATAGDGGWVELAEPIAVRAGGGFVAVPAPDEQ